ncbi:MAG: polysaccharide export protein [Acidobacteria bacterium]|nr:polysaccharide export protein [Acidobacteriota bacterium]
MKKASLHSPSVRPTYFFEGHLPAPGEAKPLTSLQRVLSALFHTYIFIVRSALLVLIVLASPLGLAAQGRPILTSPDRYRLQAGDVIEVQYHFTPEFNDTVAVQLDGYVTLPLIGGIKVYGLTLNQARATLLERAQARLKDPELNIKLREFERLFIMVSGEVERPGRVELRGAMTPIEVLAAAGGSKERVKHSQVILFRKVNPDWAEAREVDMKKALRKHRLAEDLNLRPGDLVYVPKKRISKVERMMRIASLDTRVSLLLRR